MNDPARVHQAWLVLSICFIDPCVNDSVRLGCGLGFCFDGNGVSLFASSPDVH